MKLLRSIPAVLSCWLLAAHFQFHGLLPLVVACAALPLLLLIRRNWAVRVVQLALMVGALEWLRTIVACIEARQEEGRVFLRMTVILIGVELFTVIAAVLLNGLLRAKEPPT